MDQILISILYLGMFAVLYAVAGYRFFSIHREKIWLGILVIALVTVPCYYQISHLYSSFWYGTLGQTVCICSGYGMAALYSSIRKTSILRLQEARDRASEVLSDSLGNALRTDRNFALYLRPFKVKGNLPTSLPGTHYTDSQFDGLLDFEAVLADSVRDTTPLVAMGRPLETYGAGRIPSDDQSWQAKVIELMQAARTILLIPSNRPGTRWEIQHIVQNGLIEKCIFIMPPVGAVRWTREPGEDWQYDESLVDQAGDWAVTQQALKDLGIHLPKYEQTGALFTLNRSGEQNRYVQLPLLLPTFAGVTGYTQMIKELVAQLQDDAAMSSASAMKSSARKVNVLEHEKEEVNITPGGFEITVYPRTLGAKILWLLGAALLVYLLILACRDIGYALLLLAESVVAGIFVDLVRGLIRLIRKIRQA